MPQFSYKAKKGPQNFIEGTIEADSLDRAIKNILQMGYTPIDVQSVRASKAVLKDQKAKASKNFISIFKKVSSAEVTLFIRQISDLVDAKVPVINALRIVEKQTRHPQLKEIIRQMALIVQDGGPLSSAFAKFPDVFSELHANMIKSGELGGRLDVVLNRLADFLEDDQEIRSQIKSSLLYPLFILCTGIISIFVLFTWVIPRITMIFVDLEEALPLPTVILISISGFFAKFWWLILILLGIGFFYLHRLRHIPQGRVWLDQLKLKVPFLGQVVRDNEISQFARTLGTLLENGVIIVKALDSVALVLNNHVFRSEIKKASVEVANGASLSETLRGNKFFPDAAISMIAIGEESGEMYTGLHKLAAYYQRKNQRVTKGILSLLGPALILVIGLIVFFVVIAMLMPIFRMNLIIN